MQMHLNAISLKTLGSKTLILELAIQIKWTYSHTRLHIWKRDCLIIVFVDVGIKKIKDLFVSAKYCWEGISTKWSTERRGRRPLWVLRAEFMPSLRLTRTWVAVWRLGVCASRSAPSRHRETQGCPHVPPSVAGGRRLEGWPLLLTLIAGMDTETCGTLQDLKIWHRHWIETSQGKTDWRLVDHRSLGLS